MYLETTNEIEEFTVYSLQFLHPSLTILITVPQTTQFIECLAACPSVLNHNIIQIDGPAYFLSLHSGSRMHTVQLRCLARCMGLKVG